MNYLSAAAKVMGGFCVAAALNCQSAKADVFDLRWGMTVHEAEIALGEPLKMGVGPSGYMQGDTNLTMAGSDFSVTLYFNGEEDPLPAKSRSSANTSNRLSFFDIGGPSDCTGMLRYITDRLGPETSREDRTPTFTVGGSGGAGRPGPLPRWTDYTWDRGPRPQVSFRLISDGTCGAVNFAHK